MNAILTPPAEPSARKTTGAALRNLSELILQTSRLTARGAGVSQILAQAPERTDPQEQITVGVMLRAMFWWALRSGHAPVGIKNTRRDLERTIRYIDRRLIPIAEAAKPGSARHLALPPIVPMAIDPSGAEIDVREGPPILRVLTHDHAERHDVTAVIVHILGEKLPAMSVTVNLPAGWQPTVEVMRELCQVIHTTHLANWWPGCEPTVRTETERSYRPWVNSRSSQEDRSRHAKPRYSTRSSSRSKRTWRWPM
jgi:hypothetical protein